MSLSAQRRAWIALASAHGIGPVVLERAIARFGAPDRALERLADLARRTDDRRVSAILGLRPMRGLREAIVEAASDPEAVGRRMAAIDGWLLTPFDVAYRRWLNAIVEPAPILYGRGDITALDTERSVAVVGTRRPTAAGRRLAMRVAARLVETDASVVSGLAVGIDATAHAATLDAGGQTVAVLGGGVDRPSPRLNARLARRILDEGGAIVGEHPPGISPSRGTFPRRNRLISALARGTIVVEAPLGSGALITARHALEQGRRLLIAAGRPDDRATAGGLALLRSSPARLFTDLDDMVAHLGLAEVAARPDDQQATLSADGALALLDLPQRSVARALIDGCLTTDAIRAATGLAPGVVAASVTILQLRGWARIHGSVHLPAGPLVADVRTPPNDRPRRRS